MSDFTQIAKTLAVSRGSMAQFAALAGQPGMPHSLQVLAKTAVSATEIPSLGAYHNEMRVWVEELASQSVFFHLLQNGARLAPFYCPINSVAVRMSGAVPGEGKPVAVSAVSLENDQIRPRSARALVVLSGEMARHQEASAAAGLDADLRLACASAVDADFLAEVVDSATPGFSATGTSPAHCLRDLKTVIGAVIGSGSLQSGLLVAAHPGVCTALSLLSSGGGPLFPAMAPTGGELFPNVRCIATDQISSGELVVIRGASIALAFDTITLDSSTQAAIQMTDAPADAAAALVSLFQSGSVGIRAVLGYGFRRLKDDAVATLSGAADYAAEAA